jgi:hypothetical protein
MKAWKLSLCLKDIAIIHGRILLQWNNFKMAASDHMMGGTTR